MQLCNKKCVIWAIVSTTTCSCWQHRISLFLPLEYIVSLISDLSIWWWPSVELSFSFLEKGMCCKHLIFLAELSVSFIHTWPIFPVNPATICSFSNSDFYTVIRIMPFFFDIVLQIAHRTVWFPFPLHLGLKYMGFIIW